MKIQKTKPAQAVDLQTGETPKHWLRVPVTRGSEHNQAQPPTDLQRDLDQVTNDHRLEQARLPIQQRRVEILVRENVM